MSRYQTTYTLGPGTMPPAVKGLLIANGVVFVLHYLLLPAFLQPLGFSPRLTVEAIVRIFGFTPSWAVGHGFLWQFATYLFLHGGFGHILLNMFFLWMFGSELEKIWGSKAFLRYYFVTGIGAALFQVPVSWDVPSVGASGAVYGILVAWGMLFPNRKIYLWFLVPIKAKYFVAGAFLVELWLGVTSTQTGIAHLAHVGGAVVGWLYLKRVWRIREFLSNLRWRIRRSRFRVLDRDEEKVDDWPWRDDERGDDRDDRDDWIH